MPSHPDVLIIGGGVIGLTTAYFLSKEQAQVMVMDQGDFGQEASWAGAGILPPGNAAHARTPLAQLRAQSAAMFGPLSAELHERTGIDNGFTRCGGLEFVGKEEDSFIREWREEGIGFEALQTQELRRLEPALAPGVGPAFLLPEMAQIRNPRHLKALIAACESQGVRLRPGTPVHGWTRQGTGILEAKSSAGNVAAGRFLLAAGAWSGPLLEEVGWRPGIHPIRGQIALLNPGAPLFRRILAQGKRYLVPRPDGLILVGSTEEDAGFDKRTTAGAIASLLSFAITLVPNLVEAKVERSWAGLRPGSPDGLPFLGLVPGLENLFVAAGHFRAGLQLSPATGEVMKELLLGRPAPISLEPFRLERLKPP